MFQTSTDFFQRFITALLVLVCLVGCASVPEKPSANISSRVVAASELLPVWQQWFPVDDVALLARTAAQQNNNILANEARIRIAEANARIAGAAKQLQAKVALDASRARRNVDTVSGNVPITANNYSLALNLSWEADLWGRLGLAQQAAINEYQASVADSNAAKLSLIANVYRNAFNVAEAVEQQQLNAKNRDILRSNAEIIERNFSQGTAEALDVRLTRTSLASAESQRLQSAAAVESSQRDRRLLLNLRPGEVTALVGQFATPLPTELPALPANLNVQLVEQRPDLIAARLRLNAVEARYQAASKNLLPSLRITGSGGEGTREFKELFDINDLIWSIAGNLTAPLFRGGQLRAEQALAEARRDVAVAEYAQAVVIALNEVELALDNEVFLAAREQAIATAVEESSEAETLAFERYSSGLADILTVLDAQRRVLDSKRTQLQLQNARLQNRINLLLALGGGAAAENAAGLPSY